MRKRYGFTLIELLIATSIFSVVILSLYSAFHTGILSYRKIDSASIVYQNARIVLNRIELDLKNSFVYSDTDSRFKGDTESVEFFSILDTFDKEGNIYSHICQIKYEFSDGILKRTCYKGLDALKENPSVEAEELSFAVNEVSFQYETDKANEPSQEFWPKDNQKSILPLAVRIKLVLIEKLKQEENPIEFNKVISLPQ